MTIRVNAVITVISLTLLVILLFGTNPQQGGSISLLGVFISSYMTMVGLVSFLVYYSTRVLKPLFNKVRLKRMIGLSMSRSYVYALVIAMIPLMFMSFYSAGGARWYEIMLVIVFAAIGVFYVARRS